MLGDNPWHQCPKVQFVVPLEGSWFVNTTDGGYISMGPGHVLFQEDSPDSLPNAMHYSGSNNGPCNQMVLQLNERPILDNDSCDWVAQFLAAIPGLPS
jgi:hypothetical protein